MKKKLITMILVASAFTALTACGKTTTAETTAAQTTTSQTEASTTESASTEASSTSDKTFKIGVLQLVQHDALDAANKGFIAALDESGIKYEADQQNAGGEQSACQTIANTFVSNGDDLILAIATPAAQAAAGATTDIPILVTAVTDPADSGLVDTNEVPGGNVTGTSDLTPVKEQIDLLQKMLPEAKSVGILYCSAESNSAIQAKMAQDACDAAGLSWKDYTVSSSNEIQTVVESMIGKVDVIYAPTDNMIAAGMTTVSMVATDNNIPIICGEGGVVDAGGLATYGIDYYQLGYLAGQQAVDILVNGKKPADMPIGYLSIDNCKLKINNETAATLGIDVSAFTSAN